MPEWRVYAEDAALEHEATKERNVIDDGSGKCSSAGAAERLSCILRRRSRGLDLGSFRVVAGRLHGWPEPGLNRLEIGYPGPGCGRLLDRFGWLREKSV